MKVLLYSPIPVTGSRVRGELVQFLQKVLEVAPEPSHEFGAIFQRNLESDPYLGCQTPE